MSKRERSASAAPPTAAADRRKGQKPEDGNRRLAAAFDLLKMYESKIGNKFASVAFDKVSKLLRAHPKAITCGADVADKPGVGKATVEKIDEFIKTGGIKKIDEYVKLYGEIPQAVIDATAMANAATQSKKSNAKAGAATGKGEVLAKPLTAAVLKKMKTAGEGYADLKVDALKTLLRQNGGPVSGTKQDLIERCGEGVVLGQFPKCPLCTVGKPKLNYKTGVYKCPGYMDDDTWAPCYFAATELERPKWKP